MGHLADIFLGDVAFLPAFEELLQLGIREYRQAHFKSYRLIYRVAGKQVFIYMIADGRRDMQMLLTRRMLGV